MGQVYVQKQRGRALVTSSLLVVWMMTFTYIVAIYPNEYDEEMYLCRISTVTPRCRTIHRWWRSCHVWVDALDREQLVVASGPIYAVSANQSYDHETYWDCLMSVNGNHFAVYGTVSVVGQHLAMVVTLALLLTLGAILWAQSNDWWRDRRPRRVNLWRDEIIV